MHPLLRDATSEGGTTAGSLGSGGVGSCGGSPSAGGTSGDASVPQDGSAGGTDGSVPADGGSPVWQAEGLGGQIIQGHPGLDLLLVVRDAASTGPDAPKPLCDALPDRGRERWRSWGEFWGLLSLAA